MASNNNVSINPDLLSDETKAQDSVETSPLSQHDVDGGNVGEIATPIQEKISTTSSQPAPQLTTPVKETMSRTVESDNADGKRVQGSSDSICATQGDNEVDSMVGDPNGSTGQYVTESSQGGVPVTPSYDTSIANSKSAQLLMNRFSTWRERTSEKTQSLWNSEKTQSLWNRSPALQENAKALWKQGAAHPAMTRLSAITGSGISTKRNDESVEVEAKNTQTYDESKPTVEESQASSADNGSVSSSSSDDDDATSTDQSVENVSDDKQETAEPRVIVGAAVSKAAAAASIVAESVATNFRGRYSGKAAADAGVDETNKNDRPKSAPESQTALILKSRAAKHMQEILDALEDHEFAMLLGTGMLGVNLKQCYLKNHGVFVDYLVAGGQAQLSGVVRTGDLLVRLGDIDMRKGTIAEIPQTIARTKRPVVLVLATGTRVAVDRVNYVDVAVAMMHRAREFYNEQRRRESLGEHAKDVDDQIDRKEEAAATEGADVAVEADSASDLSPSSPADTEGQSTPGSEDPSKSRAVFSAAIPFDDSLKSFETPPSPPLAVRKEFVKASALRCYDKFNVAGLCELAAADGNFRAAARNAFLTCAIDSRRLPFLARHLSSEENIVEETGYSETMAPSAQLMLFLELMSFVDLYGVTPVARQRDIASRIAHKFFLPTKVDNRLQPPLFDFHHIVPDSSLRHLEFVLGGNSRSIPRDVFIDFQKAVVDSLTGAPFLSFLASSECSRMRGYLRDTAPYVNLPLHTLFEALVKSDGHTGAKNSFAFLLTFLISQLEREPTGEHDFSEGENRRQLGAASGVCCVLFIRRTLIPAVEDARKTRNEESLRKVIHSWGKLWDEYVAPVGGALDAFTKSIETESGLNAVRELLEKAGDIADRHRTDAVESIPSVVEALLDPMLTNEAKRLADELLYDYAVNVHTKFRENKCHEWMCNELSKMGAGDPTWSNTGDLPMLPQGSVKRLLRKAEFPVGISPHKPSYQVASDDESQSKKSENKHVNADYAVVFGTSVGDELAAQMPIPGIEHSEIRRYACLSLTLERDQEFNAFSEDPIPPTFESYAVGLPRKPKPFSNVADDMRFSSDGWEVSLTSFTIPNGESSSGDATDSALFGVSLVLQLMPENIVLQEPNTTKTQLVYQNSSPEEYSDGVHTPEKKTDGVEKEIVYDEHGSAIDVHNFASPISFETPRKPVTSDIVPEESQHDTVRIVKVSSLTPTFNKRLHERSWVDRAEDPEEPLTIGIALVSRRNVIPAMRDTLSRLLHDYSRGPDNNLGGNKSNLTCRALVDVLGNFSYQDVETVSLRCILEPYLRSASAPWAERPISDQKEEFEKSALKQLSNCLTPTPLALLFVTALLEQKIVLSSSRRSVLHSATSALVSMLRPLTWSHLLVPLVPSALASDLIQYPAPFILGIPSEEKANMDLLNNLPNDVTLVDLDVGRVILAPAFALDNEMVRGTEDATLTARALRSQVLYLAQSLGSVFGSCLSRDTWCCDSPTFRRDNDDPSRDFENFRALVGSFVQELLSGLTSCCYWIEEATKGSATSEEPTVLFDEDRFFHVKNVRATKRSKPLFARHHQTDLALSLDDFDLVVESFLRVQSISTYISSRDKTEMLYY